MNLQAIAGRRMQFLGRIILNNIFTKYTHPLLLDKTMEIVRCVWQTYEKSKTSIIRVEQIISYVDADAKHRRRQQRQQQR